MIRHRSLLAHLTLVLLLSGCDKEASPEQSARPILSVSVQPHQSVAAPLAGTVQATVESELAFQTLGRVVSRRVEVGDLVRKGDVLAELDPLALQLAVTSAQASLRDAQARLSNAALTEKRRRTLAAASAMSTEKLEEAEQGLKSSQSDVAHARASLDKAREQLGYHRLTARFDGVITAVSVEPGQTVMAGQTVLKLAQLGPRDVLVDMPEAQLEGLCLGDRFNISLQVDNTVRATGTLREIAPQADTSTRTRRLKIAIDDAPGVFRLGSVVTATREDSKSYKSSILLPATAVRQQKEGHFVWVIDKSTETVSLRSVQTEVLPSDGSHILILTGLHEGEEVAIAGVNVLSPGQKVRIERKLHL